MKYLIILVTVAQLDALKIVDKHLGHLSGSYVDVCETTKTNDHELIQACDIILNTDGW